MVNEIFNEQEFLDLTPGEQQYYASIGEDFLDAFYNGNDLLDKALFLNIASTIINSSITLRNLAPNEDPYVEVGGVVLQSAGAITLNHLLGSALVKLAGIPLAGLPLVQFAVAGLATSLVTYVYAQNEAEIEGVLYGIVDTYADWGILTADKPIVQFKLASGGVQEFILGSEGNNEIIINEDTTISTSVPFLSSSYSGVANIDGMAGNDSLTGNSQSNELRGNVGDDTLAGNGGVDLLVGGPGADFVSYAYVENGLFDDDRGVFVDLDVDSTGTNGTARVENDVTDIDALREIEGVIGSKYNDTLIGSAANNTLLGGDGDDTIEGVAGNNVLSGGEGNNSIIGGSSQDTIDYTFVDSLINNNVLLDLASGTAEVVYTLDNDHDTLSGIESAITGGGDDVIRLSDVSNTIQAGDGDDTVYGLIGGNDVLDGGDGDKDLITYEESLLGDGIRIFLDSGQVFLKNGGNEVIKDTALNFEYAIGSAFDDNIIGNDEDNLLKGNQGIDIILGLDGDDTLYGGTHTDSLDGGADDDELYGGAGNDTIIGGAGNDILYGGAGADHFEFYSLERALEDLRSSISEDSPVSSIITNLENDPLSFLSFFLEGLDRIALDRTNQEGEVIDHSGDVIRVLDQDFTGNAVSFVYENQDVTVPVLSNVYRFDPQYSSGNPSDVHPVFIGASFLWNGDVEDASSTDTLYIDYNGVPGLDLIVEDFKNGDFGINLSQEILPTPTPEDLGGTITGVSWGDPHLVTYDGLAYDFQSPGEFILSRSSGEDGFEVQTRQEYWNGNTRVSVNTAVATRVGEEKVGIYLQGEIEEDFTLATQGSDYILPLSNSAIGEGETHLAANDNYILKLKDHSNLQSLLCEENNDYIVVDKAA